MEREEETMEEMRRYTLFKWKWRSKLCGELDFDDFLHRNL